MGKNVPLVHFDEGDPSGADIVAANEQQVEGVIEFRGAVVSGQGECQPPHLGELGDRQPVQTEAQDIVGLLRPLDDLLQLGEDVSVQVAEEHPVNKCGGHRRR